MPMNLIHALGFVIPVTKNYIPKNLNCDDIVGQLSSHYYNASI
jgi:hypothetical protein